MDAHHAVNGIALFFEEFGVDLKSVGDVDALDDEDVAFFLDLADSVGFEIAFACRYTARLKGAAERSGHSTTGGSYYVIQSRGVRFRGVRAYAVVFCDFGVDAEFNLAVDWQMRDPQWPFYPLQPNMRTVSDCIFCMHFPVLPRI